MALRAVAVALICIAVTHEFTLERAYWTYLTGFMLITQSFGDGIYRSLVRFIMTVVGCLIGWLIYLPFAHNPPVLLLITFISLFFMLYWLTTSLIGRNLATGILLVSAFGMMAGGWTFEMLMTRIQDTLIGALIAVCVNGFILPEFSRANVKKIFNELRTALLANYKALESQTGIAELQALQIQLQSLEKNHYQLTQNYQLARYELLLHQKKKGVYKSMLMQTNIVFFYLNALVDIKLAAHNAENPIKKELAQSGEHYYTARLNEELTKLSAI